MPEGAAAEDRTSAQQTILLLQSYPPSALLVSFQKGLKAAGARVLIAGPASGNELEAASFKSKYPDYRFDCICGPDTPIGDILARLPYRPTSILMYEPPAAFLPAGMADVEIPTLLLLGEDWIHADVHPLLIPFFDSCLTAFNPTEALYRARGLDNVRHWYFVTIPEFIHDKRLPRPVDVAFWGNLHPHVQRRRNKVVEALLELRDDGINVCVGQGAYYDAYNGRLNEAKIVVHDGQSRQINMRVIEAMAAGCMVMAARPATFDDFSANLFVEGKEIVYFDRVPHALDLVRHYLARAEEREIIAAAGHRRVSAGFAPVDVARRFVADHVDAIPADYLARRRERLGRAALSEAAARARYFALHGDLPSARRAAPRDLSPEVQNSLATAEAGNRNFNAAIRRLESVLGQRPSMAVARANLVAVRHFSQTGGAWPQQAAWVEEQLAALEGLSAPDLEPIDVEACYFPAGYERFRLETAAAFRMHPSGEQRTRRLLELQIYKTALYAAEAWMWARDYPRAARHYQRALQVVADDGHAMTNLAVAYAEAGRLEDSVRLLERSIELEPFHAAAQLNLARLFQSLGRPADARRLYRKLVKIPLLDEDERRAHLATLAGLEKELGDTAPALSTQAKAR